MAVECKNCYEKLTLIAETLCHPKTVLMTIKKLPKSEKNLLKSPIPTLKKCRPSEVFAQIGSADQRALTTTEDVDVYRKFFSASHRSSDIIPLQILDSEFFGQRKPRLLETRMGG